VVVGAERLFGDDSPKESPADRANNALFGPGGPKTAPPPPPPPPGGPGGAAGGSQDGAGGLQDGAGQAGQSYGDNVNAAAMTDEKLSELLKQIFTNNQNARDTVNAILADIQDKTKQVGPELGDPASLLSFHQYLDQKFGEIQKLLSDSQVDAKTQSAIMDALGEEYRTNSPKSSGDGAGGGDSGGSGGDDSGSGGDGGSNASGGDDGGGTGDGGGSGAGGGTDPLTDPMAGLGPMGGMDPMSMMGPAMAGLGSLPGALGGLGGMGGGSPLDALGPALQSLGPALSGAKDSFSDGKSGADDKDGSDFTDTKGDTSDKSEDVKDGNGGEQGKSPAAQNNPAAPSGTPSEQAGPQPAPGTPVAGAPAAAAGAAPDDPQKTVDMPGGTPVTAPSAERAAAMRSVIGGSSVAGAYEGQDVHLPPPGTPVLAPVSRNDLQPGDYGQFSTKAPILYMGNNKIWMDGQLQPISALQSSSDFLGWSAPPVNGAQQQTGAAAPTTPPSGKV
jgi:hypothetical protein